MLKKILNGKEVVMDTEEENAIRAEWAANDAASKLTVEKTPVEKIKAFLGSNPDVLAAVTKQK